jgi:hypothetical protein
MMYSRNRGLFDATLLLSSLNICFFFRLPLHVFVVLVLLHDTADIPCRLKSIQQKRSHLYETMDYSVYS